MQTNEPAKSTSEEEEVENIKTPQEQQQQTDPQITELKGLTDPDEPIEVEGTDNDV